MQRKTRTHQPLIESFAGIRKISAGDEEALIEAFAEAPDITYMNGDVQQVLFYWLKHHDDLSTGRRLDRVVQRTNKLVQVSLAPNHMEGEEFLWILESEEEEIGGWWHLVSPNPPDLELGTEVKKDQEWVIGQLSLGAVAPFRFLIPKAAGNDLEKTLNECRPWLASLGYQLDHGRTDWSAQIEGHPELSLIFSRDEDGSKLKCSVEQHPFTRDSSSALLERDAFCDSFALADASDEGVIERDVRAENYGLVAQEEDEEREANPNWRVSPGVTHYQYRSARGGPYKNCSTYAMRVIKHDGHDIVRLNIRYQQQSFVVTVKWSEMSSPKHFQKLLEQRGVTNCSFFSSKATDVFPLVVSYLKASAASMLPCKFVEHIGLCASGDLYVLSDEVQLAREQESLVWSWTTAEQSSLYVCSPFSTSPQLSKCGAKEGMRAFQQVFGLLLNSGSPQHQASTFFAFVYQFMAWCATELSSAEKFFPVFSIVSEEGSGKSVLGDALQAMQAPFQGNECPLIITNDEADRKKILARGASIRNMSLTLDDINDLRNKEQTIKDLADESCFGVIHLGNYALKELGGLARRVYASPLPNIDASFDHSFDAKLAELLPRCYRALPLFLAVRDSLLRADEAETFKRHMGIIPRGKQTKLYGRALHFALKLAPFFNKDEKWVLAAFSNWAVDPDRDTCTLLKQLVSDADQRSKTNVVKWFYGKSQLRVARHHLNPQQWKLLEQFVDSTSSKKRVQIGTEKQVPALALDADKVIKYIRSKEQT